MHWAIVATLLLSSSDYAYQKERQLAEHRVRVRRAYLDRVVRETMECMSRGQENSDIPLHEQLLEALLELKALEPAGEN